MADKTSKPNFNLLSFSTWLTTIFAGFAVAVYAYLGIFSRHLADDYCITGFTRSNFFAALWENYLTISDRFSNFMLIALSESIWPRSVAILPALMVVLWVFGIAWLLQEASAFSGKRWRKSLTFALSLLLVFFVLRQAPNLYQTLYWRSAMATHFAPLVFMTYFAAFLLRSISLTANTSSSRWLYPVSFFIAFILGGFSEPTVVIMMALLGCGILIAWRWGAPPVRGAALRFLTWSLAGATLALIVMALAPANALRLGSAPPTLPILISRSFLYGYQFALNSFRTLPLPAFFTVFTPFIISYGLYVSPANAVTGFEKKRVIILLLIIPILSYLLIVGSFAPSVYGQSYPVERARFSGQLCLVVALMIEGALLGILLAQWRLRMIEALPLKPICALLLGVAAIYPFRAALLTLGDVQEYSQRAKLWDAREAYLLRRVGSGETDINVPGFPGIYGIKEWDDDPNHWVNRCVAKYYSVNSVRAISVPDEDLWSVLNE